MVALGTSKPVNELVGVTEVYKKYQKSIND